MSPPYQFHNMVINLVIVFILSTKDSLGRNRDINPPNILWSIKIGPNMDVFALWQVVFFKNILVFSNTPYFGKAYWYLQISLNMLMYVDYVLI